MSIPDSTLPPQLHLSIPPATTSFKRSFEQYGFDVDHSPVGNGDNDGTDSNSNGDQRNERNKRARSDSVLSEGRRTSTLSPTHGGLAGSSTALNGGPSVQGGAGTIEGTLSMGSRTSTTHRHISHLPPRLPTPDMADMEVDIDMLPLDGSNGPHDSLHSASLSPSTQPLASSSTLPIPLPLSLSLPHVDLGLDLEGPSAQSSRGPDATGGRDGHSDLARSLERFAAFDSEIDALRRVSPPPAASPPQLPPLHLSMDPPQRDHHRHSLSSSSSTYSSETSSPVESPWNSQQPMFLEVPPALFDRPFRGLGVGSDRSATPSSRNSIDGGLPGLTASTHPPMLPPIATTSTTIWEDDSPQSPVSAAATIASSSATATQSVYGEQQRVELNLPGFDAMGMPLDVDPVTWFLPDEQENITPPQPELPAPVFEPASPPQEDTTPRHVQMDALPFGDDASGEFAALARRFSFIDDEDIEGRASSSVSSDFNPAGLSTGGASGSDVTLGAHDSPAASGVQIAQRRQSPVLPSLGTWPSADFQGWPNELMTRGSNEGRAIADDDAGRLTRLQQLLAARPSPVEPPARSEDLPSSRPFRHPLLHHPHHRHLQPSSLRSSTSLVGESRSERGRIRDELDLSLSLRSEPVAGPSSTVASATPGSSSITQASASAEERVARLEEEANAYQRQALEQLNRASELLRSIPQPWARSARDRVGAATSLINSNLEEHEPPALQDVGTESDDPLESDFSDDSDDMDIEMLPTFTHTIQRPSTSALNEYLDDMEMLSAGDAQPISFTRAGRNIHPLLGHPPPQPFLPAPALPSPDFNMDFFRDDEHIPQARPGRLWGSRPGSRVRRSPSPILHVPTEDFYVSESFPTAIRRAYQDHSMPQLEGGGSQIPGASSTAVASSAEPIPSTNRARSRLPGGGPSRTMSNPLAARMSSRDAASSSTLQSPLALPPGFDSLPHRPTAPLPSSSLLRARQDARLGSFSRPPPEFFTPLAHHQDALRRLEEQRTALLNRQRTLAASRPQPRANPVQVSAFDLLDRLDPSREPVSSHQPRRNPFSTRAYGEPSFTANSETLSRPDGRSSAFGGPQLQSRYTPGNTPTTFQSRLGSRLGAPSQSRIPSTSTSGPSGSEQSGLLHRLSNPSGPFDRGAVPHLDPLNEARERGRLRFGLPGDNDPAPGDGVRRRATAARTGVQPPPQADRTRNGESHVELRRRLLAMRNRRFNMDDFVSDSDFDASYENLLSLTRELRRGTPQDVLQSMESGVYKDWAKPDSETRCPICLDDYGQDDPVMKLKHCPHWMHRDCIQQWLNGATSCPVCRKSVLESPRASNRTIGPPSSMRPLFTPLRSRAAARVPVLPIPSTLPPPSGRRPVPEVPSSMEYMRMAQRLSDRRNSNPHASRPPLRRPNSDTLRRRRPSDPRPPTPGSGGAGGSS